MLNCPSCGNEIIKNYPNGKVKLRTNIVIWEDNRAICKCTKCHTDVKVPVKLERSMDDDWKKWGSRVNGNRTIYKKEGTTTNARVPYTTTETKTKPRSFKTPMSRVRSTESEK